MAHEATVVTTGITTTQGITREARLLNMIQDGWRIEGIWQHDNEAHFFMRRAHWPAPLIGLLVGSLVGLAIGLISVGLNGGFN